MLRIGTTQSKLAERRNEAIAIPENYKLLYYDF